MNTIERVNQERKDLAVKMNRLRIYLENTTKGKLATDLLADQLKVMALYLNILTLRIDNWEEK